MIVKKDRKTSRYCFDCGKSLSRHRSHIRSLCHSCNGRKQIIAYRLGKKEVIKL
jgi:hypothetical protein